jgi:hypothetical protein
MKGATMRRILAVTGLALMAGTGAMAQGQSALAKPQLAFMAAPVKGAPYCAQETTEHTQKLGNGTNIDRKSSATVCRDSDGRERRETETMITIMDPVAAVSYHLNKETHSGTKGSVGVLRGDTTRGGRGGGVGASGGVVRIYPMTTAAGTAQSAEPGGRRGGGGRGGADNTVAASGGGGRVGGTVQAESLGTKAIAGVQVEGTRDTRNIPAGEIGNDRPLQTVWETWFSPELNVVVLRRVSDPVNGNTVTELKDIQRSEPEPALFQVPPGFTIRDLNQN